MYEITVTQTIDSAHRVYGHQNPDGSPGKCARLHGHTYRFDVTVAGDVLEPPGFVVDFAKIKDVLNEWDHRTLLWDHDPFLIAMQSGRDLNRHEVLDDVSGVIRLPFNPTAENMAKALAERFAVIDGVLYADVVVAETAKTTARFRAVNRAGVDGALGR